MVAFAGEKDRTVRWGGINQLNTWSAPSCTEGTEIRGFVGEILGRRDSHVLERPSSLALITRLIADGMFEEDGEVWDSAGLLVAQPRQLAFTPLG